MVLYFLTGNKGKFKEAQKFIPSLEQLDLDLPEIQSLDPQEIIEAKLLEATKLKPNSDFIVEDTSLFIESMNGLPGPLIKWFIKSLGVAGLANLAIGSKLRAQVCIGLKTKHGINYFTGESFGTVVHPRGQNDFGWDPLFEYGDTKKTFAQMSIEEKNKISHRAKAFTKLKEYLDSENY